VLTKPFCKFEHPRNWQKNSLAVLRYRLADLSEIQSKFVELKILIKSQKYFLKFVSPTND